MAANASKEKAADSATCVPEQFPVGLKVLVVDDDVICLRILEQMLRKCLYSVTTCSQATAALSLLRERKGFFDIVLSDVHMPDMDGFKLLEFVGLEMDLPVIMMSGDDRTSNVMRGIRHGACDYLIKPIRTEELQNIWQHVVRKKRNVSKGQEGNLESDDDQRKCGHGNDDDDEDGSSVNEGSADGANAKNRRKRKDIKEEDGNLENDDHTMSKKQRVVWSVELHQQFVSAVNQLGIDKAVPKRILEVMNVPGLSRENVASHLQKFRLYLKRLSGVSNQQNGLSNRLGGPLDQNPKLGSFNSLDYQALVSSGRISPEILAALHTEFLNSPTGIPVLPSVDQSTVLQPSLMPKNALLCQNNPYGQPFTKIPYNISRHISSAVDLADSVALSGFGSGSSRDIVNNMAGYAVEQPGNTITRLMQYQHQGEQIIGNSRVMSLMDQDQQRYPEEHRQNLPEHNHYVISANHYGVFSQHSNNPPFTILDPEVSNCAFGGSSSSSSYYSGFVNANNNNDDITLAAAQNMIGTTNYGGPFSTVGYNNTIVCGSYDATSTSTSSKLVDNGLLPNNTTRVFGSGTIIPNRFAVDDTHPPPIMGNANQGRIW